MFNLVAVEILNEKDDICRTWRRLYSRPNYEDLGQVTGETPKCVGERVGIMQSREGAYIPL